MKPIRHAGGLESTGAEESYVDEAGAYLDYDGAAYAQVGAKGPGSLGLKLRTVLAGVALTFMTATSAGAVTFAENVSMTTGKTLAAQALTSTTLITSSTAEFNGQTDVVGALFRVTRTSQQMSLRYDISNRLDVLVASNGLTTLTAVGSAPSFTFSGGGLTVTTGGLAVTGAATFSSTMAIDDTVTLPNGVFYSARRNTSSNIIPLLGFVAGTDTLSTTLTGPWVLKDTGNVTQITFDDVGTATFKTLNVTTGTSALQAITGTTLLLTGAITGTSATFADGGSGGVTADYFNTAGALIAQSGVAMNAMSVLQFALDAGGGVYMTAEATHLNVYVASEHVIRFLETSVVVQTGVGFSVVDTIAILQGGVSTGAGTWFLHGKDNVSPTAPNRTVQVNVEGETIYLHGKTTNN